MYTLCASQPLVWRHVQALPAFPPYPPSIIRAMCSMRHQAWWRWWTAGPSTCLL